MASQGRTSLKERPRDSSTTSQVTTTSVTSSTTTMTAKKGTRSSSNPHSRESLAQAPKQTINGKQGKQELAKPAKRDPSGGAGTVSESLLKLKILRILTEGSFEDLQTYVRSKASDPALNQISPFILHIAVQVSSLKLVKAIITHWVHNVPNEDGIALDLNAQDENGNTPLHLAALQSRSDVIKLLLDEPDINEIIPNNDGALPFEICKNINIVQMMQNRRSTYMTRTVKEVSDQFKKRNIARLDELFSNPRNADFLNAGFLNRYPATNCTSGLTPHTYLLHHYITLEDVDMCEWLLAHGANPMLKNDDGDTAIFLADKLVRKAHGTSQKKLTELYKKLTNEDLIRSATSQLKEPPTFKGFLKKYTNFAHGYKLRWFVLTKDGKLSYYKDQESALKGSSRGTMDLSDCYLHIDSTEKLKFELIGGPNQSKKWSLKCDYPVETNKWVLIIQSAIRHAIDDKNTKNNLARRGRKSMEVAIRRAPSLRSSLSGSMSVSGVGVSVSKSESGREDSVKPHAMRHSHSAANLHVRQGLSPIIPVVTPGEMRQGRPASLYRQRDANDSGLEINYTGKFGLAPMSAASGASVISSEATLSDKLTRSGKDYVNKILENRSSLALGGVGSKEIPIEPRSSFVVSNSGISYISGTGTTDNDKLSIANHVSRSDLPVTGDEIGNVEEEEEEEEDEDEDVDYEPELSGDLATNVISEEDFVKKEYGPYIEELNVYQKTIALELGSIRDILGSSDFLEQKNSELVDTMQASLDKVFTSITKMNSLTLKRDEKLVALLTKQYDINNVWIQSVKDLETELGVKSDMLASFDKERMNLKKALQKKLQENELSKDISEVSSITDSITDLRNVSTTDLSINHLAEYGNSTDTLAQIAKFITNTKQKGELSDAEEFFDAEELIDEINQEERETKEEDNTTISVGHPPTVSSLTTDTVGEVISPTITAGSQELTEMEVAAALGDEVPQVAEVVRGKMGNKVIRKPEERVVTEVEMKSEPVEAKKDVTVPDVYEKDKALEEATRKRVSETLKADTSKRKEKKLVAVLMSANKAQKNKEDCLLSEGSFLGYEDGVRLRLKLDADDRPKISLWSVLKSMVGKDMTRMTLPVTFNEPTSLLQRVAEDLEYTELLDQAATFEDSTLRLLYVAAFTVSSYASTVGRIAKPFNPLLGETYEYSRPDKHYRFFAEQVSHHPPISATMTESPKWDFWGESHVATKFNGRSFGVRHIGLWYIKMRPDCLADNGKEDLYTYKKPDNTVVGILLGNPQVDNHGEVNIVNHATGDYCILNFKARGWKSSNAYEVSGEVFNKKKERMWLVGGHWNESLYGKKVVSGKNGGDLSLERTKTGKGSGPNYEGTKFLMWKASPRPQEPFNLTPFAITLNAPQPKLLPWLPPTDTRLRPDQRAMEDGEYDKAADEKHRVEEKQRAARRYRENNNLQYSPRWFTKEVHPVTKQPYWRFNGKYWKMRENKDLKGCGDIF